MAQNEAVKYQFQSEYVCLLVCTVIITNCSSVASGLILVVHFLVNGTITRLQA